MEEKELASLLQQYVLVSNNLRFKTEQGEVMWDEINRLFSTTPLADFDEVTLRDYVYTANNPEYAGNYHTINSKFRDDFNFSEEYLGNVLVYQDNHDGINEFYFNQEHKRINYLYSWLKKINKKYNYA